MEVPLTEKGLKDKCLSPSKVSMVSACHLERSLW